MTRMLTRRCAHDQGMGHPADRHSDPDRAGLGGIRDISGIPLNPVPAEMPQHADESDLARDMIAVHGIEAATVARNNARAMALAGQRAKAKFWIRVLGTIQRSHASKQLASAVERTLPLERRSNPTEG